MPCHPSHVCTHHRGPWDTGHLWTWGAEASLCRRQGRSDVMMLARQVVCFSLDLLRIFWALGEHKANARHLLALVFLFFVLFSCASVSLRGKILFCSVGQPTGGQAG